MTLSLASGGEQQGFKYFAAKELPAIVTFLRSLKPNEKFPGIAARIPKAVRTKNIDQAPEWSEGEIVGSFYRFSGILDGFLVFTSHDLRTRLKNGTYFTVPQEDRPNVFRFSKKDVVDLASITLVPQSKLPIAERGVKVFEGEERRLLKKLKSLLGEPSLASTEEPDSIFAKWRLSHGRRLIYTDVSLWLVFDYSFVESDFWR